MKKASITPVGQEITVPISSGSDIVAACERGHALAVQLGFSRSEATLIATGISELARNIVLYAGHGEIILSAADGSEKYGVVVVARDDGPGIADVSQAVTDGYSTSGGLGVGLSSIKRLMDEFEICSECGKGTTVTIRKWKR
jgi:serine/threonine-protein kinase RsbT